MEKVIIECYQRLANAIVTQAANDYIWALKALKKQRRVNFCVAVINENEEFFRSEYFVALTNSDGEYLIQRIRKECGYNEQQYF